MISQDFDMIAGHVHGMEIEVWKRDHALCGKPKLLLFTRNAPIDDPVSGRYVEQGETHFLTVPCNVRTPDTEELSTGVFFETDAQITYYGDKPNIGDRARVVNADGSLRGNFYILSVEFNPTSRRCSIHCRDESFSSGG